MERVPLGFSRLHWDLGAALYWSILREKAAAEG